MFSDLGFEGNMGSDRLIPYHCLSFCLPHCRPNHLSQPIQGLINALSFFEPEN